MQRIVLIIFIAVGALHVPAFCQQALWNSPGLVSPEVFENKLVTFRFSAPAADTVWITGDFLPTEKIKTPWGEFDIPGKALLNKDTAGVWTFTSGPLESDLYSYSFIVDGLYTTDPNNVYKIRDV
ncbi:MAG TPA: esterase, partial [Prolixibacteraceae bacterium]|nr:esterase [Prolixibacteraceae bacterium]